MVNYPGIETKSRYQIRSGAEAVASDIPDIIYLIEGKLRKQAKYAIIGKWKVAKSFFAIQMGMAISAGAEFLGFRTTASNVLYLNFEISEEMFTQRVQDMHHKLGYDLSRFRYLTINELNLDIETTQLDNILYQSAVEGHFVEVVIIDPRLKVIRKDGNQDEVLRAFCVNLDEVMRKYNLAVIIVHHEGVATGSDKAGKGSTTFDAWLDGWFKIKPLRGVSDLREIDIWSRDSERHSVVAKFNYPVHEVTPEEVAQRKAKTVEAQQCIIEFLKEGDIPEKEVRFYVLGAGHTPYAFWRAKKELEDTGTIRAYKASGPGNRKMLHLVLNTAFGQAG